MKYDSVARSIINSLTKFPLWALLLLVWIIMGSVCSAGNEERSKNVEVGKGSDADKLNKLKSFENGKKVDCYSNSRTNHALHKLQKKPNSGKQVSLKGSFQGRASKKAVEVLDTLGGSTPKLNSCNGFSIGMAPRRNKISILAFEVASTIDRGAILFHSLSETNIQLLKKEIWQSEGLQHLVSTDTKELISFVEADKREEFNIFSREVSRFGNLCKDPRWHNLDLYFSGLDLDVLSNQHPRLEAEKTMQELSSLAQNTAELYHELNAFDRFQQGYQQKIKEMQSLNLPLNGDGLAAFQSELKHQRKLVKSLQKKSLWSKNLDAIVEMLVDIVNHTHQAISEFLGINAGATAVKNSKGTQRLGEAGLALHYANIINQINVIASRPTILPPNLRDTLYHGLPNNIKSVLYSRLQNDDVTKGLSVAQVKAGMDKTLLWLTPFATNTTKALQGFGWVGEWANASNNLGNKSAKESNMIRLQTLYYADKQKIDFHILELLTQLDHLVSFVRYSRRNTMKPTPKRTSSSKALYFHSKMLQFISIDQISNGQPLVSKISQEDRRLLEEVCARRRSPGVSKSENFAVTKKREVMLWHFSNSVESSSAMGFFPTKLGLDVMDGI